MKRLVIFFSLQVCFIHLFAQDDRIVTVKPGQDISTVFSKHEIYRYVDFANGKVYFKDGSASRAKMNYNLLLGEMMFINPAGDTLAIKDKEAIKYIVIGADSIYYSGGFIELVKANLYPRLGVQHLIKVVNKQKVGAYNIPSATTKIESYNAYAHGRPNDNIVIDENSMRAKSESYYFADQDHRFYPANKKSLFKLYKGNDSELKKYLKEKQLDFKNKQDLILLVNFLQLMAASGT